MSTKPFQYNLEEFIRANAPYLTVSDIVEETGVKRHFIQRIMDEHNIKAISKGEQTDNFIRDMADKFTVDEFCSKFDIGITRVNESLKKLGIKMRGIGVNNMPIKKSDTISDRLNTVKLDPDRYGKSHFGLRYFESKDI